MTSYAIFEADSFPVKVNVTDEETGGPLPMSGITWEAWAARNVGGPSIPATVSVIEDGVLMVRFEPDSFAAATYQIQIRGTRGADVQTLQPRLLVSVSRSIRGE